MKKRPSECSILVVDDEEVVGEVLETALKPHYRVVTCTTGRQACTMINEMDFDVIVTDLKLPDISGLDILKYAKSKDEYTEVIMITGYASLDSATNAINLGVSSYYTKPLNLTEFLIQVEKSVASRLFHLKSVRLMQQSDYMAPDVKDHLFDITSLYYFTRKLMLSLEISEIMRITLEEANQKSGAVFSAVGVNVLGYTELYAMPQRGEISRETVLGYLESDWEQFFSFLDKGQCGRDTVPISIYKGRQGESPLFDGLVLQSIPMVVTGKAIGSLVVYRSVQEHEAAGDQNQFLYVFASLAASIVEHGYSDMQARHQAKTDSLTGIANHRQFQETLDREIARANRRKTVFSLVLIDIDDFKKVNDTYGHQVGDAVLIDLTMRIQTMIRAGDVLARYGGEEFGLILPDTDAQGAAILASRVCQEIAGRPFIYSHSEINYTASLGIAIYSGDQPAAKDVLIELADSALYTSKRDGKNKATLNPASL